MRLFIAFLLLVLCPAAASAQFEYFNSEPFWNRLALQAESDLTAIQPGDTAIIVASNRQPDSTGFRFLPEVRDGDHIRYYLVYSGKGKWNVRPVHSLEAAARMMPERNKDWVVYTEGMGKFFTSDVDRGMGMAAQYGVNVILLDYPSITSHKKRLGNYFFAHHNAMIAYKDFLPVLDTIRIMREQKRLGSGHLSLFFHSMGNMVVWQLIKHGGLDRINGSRWVTNLVLNAPCVPQHGHRKWVDRIQFADRIYIHYNPHDFTLGGAFLLSKRNQLGMKLRKPLSTQAVYINFNTLANKGHSNFLNLYGRGPITRAATRHYRTLLHGGIIDVQDTVHYQPAAFRGIGYDILPEAGDETRRE